MYKDTVLEKTVCNELGCQQIHITLKSQFAVKNVKTMSIFAFNFGTHLGHHNYLIVMANDSIMKQSRTCLIYQGKNSATLNMQALVTHVIPSCVIYVTTSVKIIDVL